MISVTRDDAPIVALSRNNFSKNGVGARCSFRSNTSSYNTEGDKITSNRNSRAVRDALQKTRYHFKYLEAQSWPVASRGVL